MESGMSSAEQPKAKQPKLTRPGFGYIERIGIHPAYILYGAFVALFLIVSLRYNPFYQHSEFAGIAKLFTLTTETSAVLTFTVLVLLARFRDGGFTRLSRLMIGGASASSVVGLGGFFLTCHLMFMPELFSVACGLLFGIGKAILTIAWVYLFSMLNTREMLLYNGLGLCFSVPFSAGSNLISLNLLPLLLGVSLLLGIAYPLWAAVRGKAIFPLLSGTQKNQHSARELAPVFKWVIISPILGVAILSFCDSFTSDVSSMTVNAVTLAVPLAAFVLLLPFVLLRSRFAILRSGFSILLPILAAALLLLIGLPAAQQLGTLISTFHQLLSSVVHILAWCFIASMVRSSDYRPLIVAGMFLAFQSLPSLLGYLLMPMSASIRAPLTLVITSLFLIYLIWSFAWNTVRRSKEESGVTTSSLEEACAAVCQRFALSARESEILNYLGRGYSSTYIAKDLFISENTVRSHIKNIYRKMNIDNRQNLLDIINGK